MGRFAVVSYGHMPCLVFIEHEWVGSTAEQAMFDKDKFSKWSEDAWGAAMVINILVTIIGFPAGYCYLVATGLSTTQACLDSGLINICGLTPLGISFVSIFALIMSRNSHNSLQHVEAMLFACFPILAFLAFFIVSGLSPC